jgi:hypothetical protein
MMKHAFGALVKKYLEEKTVVMEENPGTVFVCPQTAPHELRIIAHAPLR